MLHDRLLFAALFAVMGFGIVMRFWGLETHVFWHDEVYTRFFAAGYQAHDWKPALFTGEVLGVADVLHFQTNNPDKGLMDVVRGLANDEPQHPPVYYVLVRTWVGLFGDSVAALRSLSAAVSVLALPAMAWLCREVSGSWRAGAFGAALLAVSPFFVLYAQEAREYALWSVLILLTNASLLTAIRATRARWRSTVGWWGLFSVLTALSLYVAFSSYAIIAAQILYIIVICRGRPSRVSLSAAAAMAISAIVFAPWAWMLWGNLEAFQTAMKWTSSITIPQWEVLASLLLSFSRPFVDFWDNLEGGGGWIGVSVSLLGCCGVGLWLFSRGRSHWREPYALLVGLVVVPVALLLVPDLVWGGIRSLSTRYLTGSLLAVLVIAALWSADLARRGRLAPVGALLLCGAGSVVGNSLHPAPWTKGLSVSLPLVAERINASASPLLVANMERHHPGNVLALCHLLRPETRLQFIPFGVGYETPWTVDGDYTDIFLFSPIPPFVQEPFPVPSEKLYEDLFLELWRVDSSP